MSIHVFCSNGPCTRDVSPENVVPHDGKNYCSQGCAEGRGCEHPECGCSDLAQQTPETRRLTAKAS